MSSSVRLYAHEATMRTSFCSARPRSMTRLPSKASRGTDSPLRSMVAMDGAVMSTNVSAPARTHSNRIRVSEVNASFWLRSLFFFVTCRLLVCGFPSLSGGGCQCPSTEEGLRVRTAVIGHVEWVEFVHVQRVPRPGEIVHA